jgi:hypothetical protein
MWHKLQINPQLQPRTGLGDVAGDLTLQAQAQMNAQVAAGQAQLAKLGGQAKATWDASQTALANNLRIVNGANAAAGLLQNGYDPNSDADNQAAITAVAGGLSLIPAVGPLLGGALLILDAIALGIAKGLEAIGLIAKPGCFNTQGTWTPAQIVASTFPNGIPYPPGSFATLVVAALAQNTADRLNCKPTYPNEWILTGIVALWNAGTVGHNSTKIFVPTLDPDLVPMFKQDSVFGRMTENALVQSAFQPVANVSLTMQEYGQTIDVNDGPYTPPLNVVGIVRQPPVVGGANASTTTSTAGKVATGAVVVTGAAAIGIGIWAWATKQAYSSALKRVWSETGGRLIEKRR